MRRGIGILIVLLFLNTGCAALTEKLTEAIRPAAEEEVEEAAMLEGHAVCSACGKTGHIVDMVPTIVAQGVIDQKTGAVQTSFTNRHRECYLEQEGLVECPLCGKGTVDKEDAALWTRGQ